MSAYNHLTDQELLELTCSGDQLAYAEIYHRYKFILHQHAWNKLRDKEEAQDVLQEVFVNLWSKREMIKVSTNLSGYLYTAVRNRVLDHFSHHGVKLRYINNVKPNIQEAPTDYRVRESQLKDLIEKEIAELPPRMRQVFELSRKQNMTYRQIAEQLGTSEETVKKQLSTALRGLRVKFGSLFYILLIVLSTLLWLN